MDPITHTLVGVALGTAGLRRHTPLATGTLILAANAPDIDVFSYASGPYAALAFRRGWTHGPLAWVLLPLAVAGLVLAYDRLVRARRGGERARAGPVLGLAALGVATHPLLDWLNNYGIRWLMPFDRRWYYGDTLFIVDLWVWLALGGALFLAHSRKGLALLAALGARGRAAGEWAARIALGAVALYIFALVVADAAAQREVLRSAAEGGIEPVQAVMVSPVPLDPLGGQVVVASPTDYYLGDFHWLRRPRVRLSLEGLPRRAGSPGPIEAAARTPDAARYLSWSRFPFIRAEPHLGGYRVHLGDARYTGMRTGGSLQGITVFLGPDLQPR